MGNASAFFSALVSMLWTWMLIGVSVFAGYRITQEKSLEKLPGFDLLPSFLRIPLQQQTDNQIVLMLFGVLTGFLLFFLLGYCWQAIQDFLRLALVRASLERANRAGYLTGRVGTAREREAGPLLWQWFYYPRMSHLWREYAETLHRQTVPTTADALSQIRYRSTIAAETIFSVQALVDVPMRVEFFRHLPGILTGAGIVSTFAGILLGLSAFDPSVEVQQITLQLKNLFTGITTAFIASFFAIFAAILVTIVEKFLLHWRYAQVTTLQHYVDDLFRAGIEPEYLAHLVNHGETEIRHLQAEMGRLAATIPPPQQTLAQPLEPLSSIRPLEPHISLPAPGADGAEPFRGVLNNFLQEFSQLLQRTLETYGRRREEGRALDIQLISVGERLDVAMGEFASAVVEAKREISGNHAAVQELLQRQLAVLEQLDARMTQQGDAQWGRAMDEMVKELPTREELALWVQSERQEQTDALRSLQKAMEKTVGQLPDKEDAARLLTEIQGWRGEQPRDLLPALQETLEKILGRLSEREEMARLLREIQGWRGEQQRDLLPALQETLEKIYGRLSEREEMARLLTEIQGWRGEQQRDLLPALQETLEKILGRLSDREDAARLLTEIQGWRGEQQRDLLPVLQENLERLLGRLSDKEDAARLLTEIQGWHAGMEQGVSRQLQDVNQQVTRQFSTLEQELSQIKALSAQMEVNAGLLCRELADRVSNELQQNLQARSEADTGEVMAERVAERLFTRLEQTFGTLSKGLFELRDRFSSERDLLVSAMEGWRADVSRADEEQSQHIEQKISEVISQVNTHHSSLTKVIDELNQGLSQDLDGMRTGLLSKSEESTQEMVQKVAELGRILEESIHTVGQEQTVFIEMLGERLEALRRRMRTK
ncbi:MAG: hypothetical protein H7835_02615 [Magnetococcus sp. XQGC-1]